MPTRNEFEAAADWIEDADSWTDERRRAFLTWVGADPNRMEAVRRVWALSEDRALDEALAEWRGAEAGPLPVPKRRRWLVPGAGIAAVVALTAIGAPLLRATPPTEPALLLAAAGAPRSERMADGSIVTLDGGTALRVVLADARRSIDIDRGRATFAVAHDVSRPFVVRAGTVSATALGTVYSVETIGRTVRVTVAEGRVRLAQDSRAITLDAGEAARVEPGGRIDRERRGPDEDAWIDAEREPLAVLVEQLQRRTTTRLAADDRVARLPVSGRFRRDDAAGSLALVAEANGLRVRQSGDALTLVRR